MTYNNCNINLDNTQDCAYSLSVDLKALLINMFTLKNYLSV